ncbi:Phage protein [Collimonas arenae]|uniref:Phage protein n=1 Tax=Collimonas arenae TaxID=279058 RepID=A0A0A1F8U7_9BURK|nr:hypothetical protein [Collimonas arenae]AIY40190.1 Phage protein [Collimonas arenae]
MIGHVIPATYAHAYNMAPRMRTAEVAEVWASDRRLPLEALVHELDNSALSWSWVIDGQVACMFGFVLHNLLDSTAYPWFLTSDLVETHSRSFIRACKSGLPGVLAQYPDLKGMVDARYVLSIRWLEWLGFVVGDPVERGPDHTLFRPFYSEKKHASASA